MHIKLNRDAVCPRTISLTILIALLFCPSLQYLHIVNRIYGASTFITTVCLPFQNYNRALKWNKLYLHNKSENGNQINMGNNLQLVQIPNHERFNSVQQVITTNSVHVLNQS